MSNWQKRNERAIAKGYRNYYDYRIQTGISKGLTKTQSSGKPSKRKGESLASEITGNHSLVNRGKKLAQKSEHFLAENVLEANDSKAYKLFYYAQKQNFKRSYKHGRFTASKPYAFDALIARLRLLNESGPIPSANRFGKRAGSVFTHTPNSEATDWEFATGETPLYAVAL